jgi:hypothetical protein
MGELLDLVAYGHPAWHADAVCPEHPELDWFADEKAGVDAAVDVCRSSCLARLECYAFAMASSSSLVGVWVGTTPEDRAQLRPMTSPAGNMRRRPRQLIPWRPPIPRETGDNGRIIPRMVSNPGPSAPVT